MQLLITYFWLFSRLFAWTEKEFIALKYYYAI